MDNLDAIHWVREQLSTKASSDMIRAKDMQLLLDSIKRGEVTCLDNSLVLTSSKSRAYGKN